MRQTANRELNSPNFPIFAAMEIMNENGQYFQHTIRDEISISGAGIHTGQSVTMRLKQAEANTGIIFQRIDLPGKPTVKADVDNVIETLRSTTVQSNGARVGTIEHLMASLVGMQIDNVLIEIDGEEVPILDGSAQPFIELLQTVGSKKQDAKKVFYTIQHNITFVDEGRKVEMVALPYNGYRINTLIDFNSPVLGTQHAALKQIEDFNQEIAPCRTFCFFHELEALHANNLIKGGDLNNAIVVIDKPVTPEQVKKIIKVFNLPDVQVSEEGILNNLKLRFPNEPARHKLLDVVGDLALVGFPFKAHIIANRPGHASNIAFARKIKEHIKKYKHRQEIPKYDPCRPPILDIHAIEKNPSAQISIFTD